MTIRFDDAWSAIITIALGISRHGWDVVALRDIVGRISIILDNRATEVALDDLDSWQNEMRTAAGKFFANNPTLLATQLFRPDEIFEDPDLLDISEPGEGRGRCALLERRVVGGDWSRVRPQPATRRVTLYGFKGSVGRSSATFLLAQRLAETGKSVLVIDLDLESPGIGPLLQSESKTPEFGLVDYFVEAAVGNEAELDLVVRSDQIRVAGNGEIWVAPARGAPREGYAYLPKLNRVYTELPSGGDSGHLSFARRLESAVIACEAEVERRSRVPDVVLLDSRAGIHDVAAVAITQLSDLSLLFATDNPQTWTGYRDLFRQWSFTESRKFRSSTSPPQWKTAKNGDRHVPPERVTSDKISEQDIFAKIAGPYMGMNHRKGHTYPWLPNHLMDGGKQVSPRSFLSALATAAEITGNSYGEHDRALHYDAIRTGVQAASRIRVGEIREDIPWVATAVSELDGLQVPMERDIIRARWRSETFRQKISIGVGADNEEGEETVRTGPEADAPDGLIEELRELGVMTYRTDGRVDLPDVYRIAFNIGRKGGVPKVWR